MNEILRTENITKKFGGLIAVNNVTISIKRGSITAIIGPNGAGKTTFLNLISGVIYPDTGRIYFEGIDITRKPPYERAKLGISRSFQSNSVLQSLTVFDNMRASIIGVKNSMRFWDLINILQRKSDGELYREIHEIIDNMGLKGREWLLAQHLTQAEQRVLDIAMAIAAKPKLLLLDEPTSGLAAEDVPRIIKLIKSLKEATSNLTIILVEHKLEVVKSLADRVIVMHEGRILADGSYNDVVSNGEVIEAYLGASDA
ncbi:MAG: ABC transporter ATP-binding protein [Sulfolobales archaeon]